MTSFQSLTAPAPPTIHRDTLASPRAIVSARGPHGPLLVLYCRRNRVGACYHVQPPTWALWAPLTLDEFLQSLHARGIKLPGGDALEAWLHEVSDGTVGSPLGPRAVADGERPN